MTRQRGGKALATAALLLVAVAACADDSDDPGATGSQSPSASTHSSTTSIPTTDSEQAADSASAVLRRYFAVVDDLRQHPSKSLGALKTVATTRELTAQQRLIEDERRQGRMQAGDTRLAELTVQSVNLDNSDPQSGVVPTVQVDVCWDVSAVDIVDRSGDSVVTPSRPDTGWLRLTVANYQWSKDAAGGWRVASSRDLEKAPCAAS